MKALRLRVLAVLPVLPILPAALAGLALLAPAVGCSTQIIGPSGGTGSTGDSGGTGAGSTCGGGAFVSRLTTQAGVTQVDLLLMVDNGASAAEKQAELARSLPDLIDGLTNPQCLDIATSQPLPASAQPSGPLDPCPPSSRRAFTPIVDMHVGVLSSSLGTFGASACPDPTSGMACAPGATNNDRGHLITRSDPCGMAAPVPTYQNLGFLAWDPEQKLSPPGEDNLGDPSATPPVPGLTTSVGDLVTGDGSFGCGFRSQNESWYRFLVDPTPWSTITLGATTQVQTSGVDQTLLAQRKDFLRPGSVLAIVTVTDHTDSSLKEYSSYPVFADLELHLPHARTECTTKGPTDPCCFSCGQSPPSGCSPNAGDPNCSSSYTSTDENVALRGFGLESHKQRYGIEFFYPPSRYVQALTSATVADESGKMVQNPIYSVLDPSQPGTIRDPSQVFYGTITGVPWQLIARQKSGKPDLVNGVSALDQTQVGGFKTSAELALLDSQGHSFWDDIAGDPENYVAPRSPFMLESTVPRTGVDPITGIATSPPTAVVDANAVNGRERTIPTPAGDIEYACTFPMLAPVDCTANPSAYCECTAADSGNPLCDPANPTSQVRAKAYPGLKNLAIAKGMGDQGIVGSLCAAQITDDTAPDYGYRPSVGAITSVLQSRLRTAEAGQCLPKALPTTADGQASCKIIEAVQTVDNCSCNGPGRIPVPAEDACFQQAVMGDPLAAVAQWNCFCEIAQTSGAELTDCETVATSTADGWCYVDPSTAPASEVAAETALVAACPSGSQRTVRFVGAGAPAAGSTIFLACE